MAEISAAVLGVSSLTYAEATWAQTLPDRIGANVRMFRFFGAVPRLLVPDSRWQGVYTKQGVDTVLGFKNQRPTSVAAGVLELLPQDCLPSGVARDGHAALRASLSSRSCQMPASASRPVS